MIPYEYSSRDKDSRELKERRQRLYDVRDATETADVQTLYEVNDTIIAGQILDKILAAFNSRDGWANSSIP